MIFRRKKKKEDMPAGRQGIEEEVEEKTSRRRKKEEEDNLVWDKKRILIAIGIVLLLIIAVREVKDIFFPNTNILGESTTKRANEVEKPDVESPNLDLTSQVTTSLEDVKESIGSIDPAEVASSSPQIQKVLRDIQGIRNLPVDKAREACYSICSGL